MEGVLEKGEAESEREPKRDEQEMSCPHGVEAEAEAAGKRVR